jgi:hypothetical protein
MVSNGCRSYLFRCTSCGWPKRGVMVNDKVLLMVQDHLNTSIFVNRYVPRMYRTAEQQSCLVHQLMVFSYRSARCTYLLLHEWLALLLFIPKLQVSNIPVTTVCPNREFSAFPLSVWTSRIVGQASTFFSLSNNAVISRFIICTSEKTLLNKQIHQVISTAEPIWTQTNLTIFWNVWNLVIGLQPIYVSLQHFQSATSIV